MNKILLSLLGIMTFTSAFAEGTGTSYSIPTEATLGRGLAITEIDPVSFGTIALSELPGDATGARIKLNQNGNVTIEGTGSENWRVSGQDIGQIRISGNPNSWVSIPSSTQEFTLSAGGVLTTLLQFTPSTYPTESILLGSDGFSTVLVGGSLAIPQGTIGMSTYTGKYSITVAYQ